MFLMNDGSEQGLFSGIAALADTGTITVCQSRHEKLVQAQDELMMKRRPEFFVFKVWVHTWEKELGIDYMPIAFHKSGNRSSKAGYTWAR